ncbi:uncharacterized protein LOC6618676 [Drosophila sechellia]|uniref:GM11493 n=1 Tax=Drosophila sechellia TaxID=7238 RepID=B4IGS5_DROSE|nr:uncharacterized protein LOC6618676 [Drosophila sechellia]EDW49025.1 GM11493 [Drosophila sechellia]
MRKMQVLVQTIDGKMNVYEVDRFGTVANLKARIGRAMSVPMGFSRLSYKGRLLSNEIILEEVGHMSILDLTWKPVVLTPKQLCEKRSGKFSKIGYGRKDDGDGMLTLIGGYQQRTDQAGGDDELKAEDLTGFDLLPHDFLDNGQTELKPIALLDLMDSLDLNKATKNDNEK